MGRASQLQHEAGLVSIVDAGDGNWRYQLRRDGIHELGDLLRSYIGDQS